MAPASTIPELSDGAVSILTAEQVREADRYTIRHEPVASIDLMERAADAASRELGTLIGPGEHVDIVCGPGNNGGDGLAIARMLRKSGHAVRAWLIRTGDLSPDCSENLRRLRELDAAAVKEIAAPENLQQYTGAWIVDALFGTGLTRPAEGLAAAAIRSINTAGRPVVSVDMPSGLYADAPVPADAVVVRATVTLTFESPKLAFLMPENDRYVGTWRSLSIGLDQEYIRGLRCGTYYVTAAQVGSWFRPRRRFSHKGDFGRALLVAGSRGMMGAAVLAARACLRSGCGVLTAHLPKAGVPVMQGALPEAIVRADADEAFFTELEQDEIQLADAIGAGPGIAQEARTANGIHNLLQANKPVVLDADALNILASNRSWLESLPQTTILTPHPGEFRRLAGNAADGFDNHRLLYSFATAHNAITVLKGAYTCTALPDGTRYFNSTGSPSLSIPGSGDVLTGIILSLLAQGFSADKAAIAGVFLHGLAGDIAVGESGSVGLLASDIVRCIPYAIDRLSE
jgi:hydroxyethylthiazole kinase-like uncharacterized protein yjeF